MKHLFDRLEQDNSRNGKIAILQENKGNDLFKDIFSAALNPYVQYFIRKIPEYTRSETATASLSSFLEGVKDLSSRKVTGHAATNHLATLLSMLSEDDAVIAERIIKKDLRCGVNEATVNKVWDDLIPTYPCLLANPGDEKNMQHIKYPAYSQLKSDGARVNFVCRNGVVVSYSRAGRVIDFHGKLDKHFAALEERHGSPCVFDGELVVVDKDGNVLPRKIGNGIINKAIKGTISEKEAEFIRAQIWDIIPYDDFLAKKCSIPYSERFKRLQHVVDNQQVEIIETRVVNSHDDAIMHFSQLRDLGFEGTILKNLNGIWEDKRSKDLVKMKAEEEADLEVVGWNPGTGRFAGKVGSLVCVSSDREIEVSISGFTDELRDEISANINEWIGKIVTVRYNEKITSQAKDKKTSLFLPRFVEIRLDKDVANSADEIV